MSEEGETYDNEVLLGLLQTLNVLDPLTIHPAPPSVRELHQVPPAQMRDAQPPIPQLLLDRIARDRPPRHRRRKERVTKLESATFLLLRVSAVGVDVPGRAVAATREHARLGTEGAEELVDVELDLVVEKAGETETADADSDDEDGDEDPDGDGGELDAMDRDVVSGEKSMEKEREGKGRKKRCEGAERKRCDARPLVRKPILQRLQLGRNLQQRRQRVRRRRPSRLSRPQLLQNAARLRPHALRRDTVDDARRYDADEHDGTDTREEDVGRSSGHEGVFGVVGREETRLERGEGHEPACESRLIRDEIKGRVEERKKAHLEAGGEERKRCE